TLRVCGPGKLFRSDLKNSQPHKVSHGLSTTPEAMLRRTVLSLLLIITMPASAAAAESAPLEFPLWTAGPFVLLLLAIAILPLVAERFWHHNFNKAVISLACALPIASYLIYHGPETESKSLHLLFHALEEYGSFIILLASLYVVSGGIVLRGDIQARPLT